MTDKLIKGFEEFCKGAYDTHNAIMPRLVRDGQDPEYFVISCIDSRSNPATIFNALPGIFFAHKAMGAIVRPYQKGTALSAALQFALSYNNVNKVVVLGHTGCGAVNALVKNIEDEEIASFLSVAQSGLNRAQHICTHGETEHQFHRCAEEQIVLQSVKNLKTYPAVKKALSENRLTIKPWLFDMENGDLLGYDKEQEAFVSLTA